MNTKMTKLALAIGAMVLASNAMATSDTASAAVDAVIVSPISITNTTALAFGKFAKPNSGISRTSIVGTADTNTGGTADFVTGGTFSSATFPIVSDSLVSTATVSYSTAIATGLTLGTVMAKCGAGTETAVATPAGTAVPCPAATSQSLKVGGTLTITDTVETAFTTAAAKITVIVAYD